MVTIESFGFKWGEPNPEAEWVADVRDINSDVYAGLENLTGLDSSLREKVLATPAAQAWLRKFEFDVMNELEDGDLINVGCSHGQHRSVSVAIGMAELMDKAGIEVQLVHRDIDKADTDSVDDESGDRDTTETMETMSNVKQLPARNWYDIKNVTDEVADVFIYDQIGEDWWTGEGVTSKSFIADLNGIKARSINLHVNSPGGSVFDGLAIANALQRHPAHVTTYVDGLAASIASVIALAGDRIVMAENAMFMIHNPSGGVQGTSEDMRKMADVLDKIRDTLVNTYEARTGAAREDIIAALDAETWFSADEALAAGYIDEVSSSLKAAASFDLSKFPFRHAPQASAIDDAADACGETCEDCTCVSQPEDSDSTGAVAVSESVGATEPRKTEAFVEGLGFIKL